MKKHQTILCVGSNYGKAQQLAMQIAAEVLAQSAKRGLNEIRVVIYPSDEIQHLKNRIAKFELQTGNTLAIIDE